MKTDGLVYDIKNGVLRFYYNVEYYDIVNTQEQLMKDLKGYKLEWCLVPLDIKKDWMAGSIRKDLEMNLFGGNAVIFYEL